MKKLFLFITLHLLLFFSLSAQVKISFEPLFSTSFGKYDEYVDSFSGTNIVSQLEWQQLPLFKYGALTEISIGNFSLMADILFGVPSKCGKMYDSDWNDNGIKTTYSISNNYAQKNFNYSLAASYTFYLGKVIIIPQITFEYYYDLFQSKDGKGWYGSEDYSKSGSDVRWDSPDSKYYSKLSRIDLKRESWYVFSGINICIPLGDNFNLQAGTFIAPLAITYNSDYHHDDNNTNLDFYLNSCQKMYFSRYEEKLCVQYKINKNLIADCCINTILGGPQKSLLEGWEQYAGTDVFTIDLRLGMTIFLFN